MQCLAPEKLITLSCEEQSPTLEVLALTVLRFLSCDDRDQLLDRYCHVITLIAKIEREKKR